MTYEGLGGMFKSDSADTCAGMFSAGVDGGPSGWSSVRRHGSEDTHRRQGKLLVHSFVYDWGLHLLTLLD